MNRSFVWWSLEGHLACRVWIHSSCYLNTSVMLEKAKNPFQRCSSSVECAESFWWTTARQNSVLRLSEDSCGISAITELYISSLLPNLVSPDAHIRLYKDTNRTCTSDVRMHRGVPPLNLSLSHMIDENCGRGCSLNVQSYIEELFEGSAAWEVALTRAWLMVW